MTNWSHPPRAPSRFSASPRAEATGRTNWLRPPKFAPRPLERPKKEKKNQMKKIADLMYRLGSYMVAHQILQIKARMGALRVRTLIDTRKADLEWTAWNVHACLRAW